MKIVGPSSALRSARAPDVPELGVGAAAQAQQVSASAGLAVTGELIVDPRYVWVIGHFS